MVSAVFFPSGLRLIASTMSFALPSAFLFSFLSLLTVDLFFSRPCVVPAPTAFSCLFSFVLLHVKGYSAVSIYFDGAFSNCCNDSFV